MRSPSLWRVAVQARTLGLGGRNEVQSSSWYCRSTEVRELAGDLEREVKSTRSQVADHETVCGLHSFFAHQKETSA